MERFERKFELTSWEKACFYPTLFGDYIGMSICFFESQDDKHNFEIVQSFAVEALKILQERHPFLRAHLDMQVNENKDRVFIVVGDDITSECVEFVDLSNEQTTTRERLIEMCIEFNTRLLNWEKRLWRAQIISYKEEPNVSLKHLFNWVISIAISDGFNKASLTIEFVNILNALATDTACKEMSERLEPCESLNFYCEKYNLFSDEKLKSIDEAMKTQKQLEFRFDEKFRKFNERGYFLDLFKFGNVTSAKLISTCKSFNVRPTAYFYTVFFYALNSLYKENGLDFPKELLIRFPINLRVRLNPTLSFSDLRFLVTSSRVAQTEAVGQFGEYKHFWNDCDYIQSLVQKSTDLNSGAMFSCSHQYDALDEYNQIYHDTTLTNEQKQKKLADANNYHLSLSNLGAFVSNSVEPFPGPFHIRELYFSDSSQSYPNVGLAMQFHIFYWKGELMIQLGANKACIGSSFCKRFINIFKELINKTIF